MLAQLPAQGNPNGCAVHGRIHNCVSGSHAAQLRENADRSPGGPSTVFPTDLPRWTNTDVRLVGREADMRKLRMAWKKATAGSPQAVFVSGDPGVGKTRLILAFLAEQARNGTRWLAHKASERAHE